MFVRPLTDPNKKVRCCCVSTGRRKEPRGGFVYDSVSNYHTHALDREKLREFLKFVVHRSVTSEKSGVGLGN